MILLLPLQEFVFDICPREVSYLHFMFYLLCCLPLYSLGTSPSFTQVTPLLGLHRVDDGPRAHHSRSQPSVKSNLHIGSKCAYVWHCLESLPHLISQCPPTHHLV
ncbi:hypothetical protein BHE74_00043746 [Ensete ventricosum]|nr:hypothetical protein BHE74_00043746 [Ensete ventricosum]RZS06656.1 hypothetical protein BHM03_00037353 [Ensete ventricosum]